MVQCYKATKESAIKYLESVAHQRGLTIDIWEAYDINGSQVSLEEV